MSAYPELFVLRHGQTEWNAAGRHQGRLDSPLTDLGRRQAATMGDILLRQDRPWDTFDAVHSPQGRAASTAGIVFAAIGRAGRADDRLMEVAFGTWEGKTIDDIAQGQPDIYRAWDEDPLGMHFRAPGGETLDQMIDRCRSFLNDLTRPTVVVCHGITSRVLRSLWLGLKEEDFGVLEGGQGIVYHLADGVHRRLEAR